MQLNQMALPVLGVLHGLQKHYGKDYCYPSQDKLLELLEKWTLFRISRRTLNRYLARMEASGLIVRVRRHHRHKVHGMVFRSTLYKITLLGLHSLVRVGVISWKELNSVVSKIKNAYRRGTGRRGVKRDRRPYGGDLLNSNKVQEPLSRSRGGP